jgi:translation initiation factor 3 subunit E
MTDYVADLWRKVNNSENVPEEFARKREEVLERLRIFEEESEKIQGLLEDESVVNQLRSDKVANLKFLEESYGVTIQMVDVLYDFGRFHYECGTYDQASDLLYKFRVLSTDNDKVAKATWGKLVCDILTTNWEGVMEEINKLKESIETRLFNNPRAQLTARESLCPWILRYLAAAVITNRTRGKNATPASHNYQKQLKDLVRIVKQEIYEYQDPVTEFVKALYVDFDFEEAQRKLLEAEEVLRVDFFLSSSADAFVESARHLISESYCKIHQRIDIK